MSRYQFPLDILSEVRVHLEDPSLELFLNDHWGSHHPQYRQLLHTDLKLRGRVADSSISHTEGLGGYLVSQNHSHKIGFDLEVVERVKPEVARRICETAAEFEEAPSPASLWAAKEASYKALKGPQQPLVVMQIRIGGWQKHASQIETCRIENHQKLEVSVTKGITYLHSGYVYSFFSVRP